MQRRREKEGREEKRERRGRVESLHDRGERHEEEILLT